MVSLRRNERETQDREIEGERKRERESEGEIEREDLKPYSNKFLNFWVCCFLIR